MYDTADVRQIRHFQEYDGHRVLEFSPSGRLLAGGSGGGPIAVWNLETHRRVCEGLGHRIPERVNGIRFSPDEKTLLSFSSDQTARLWDLSVGSLVHVLPHNAFVSDGQFLGDGAEVVTVGHDGRALVWDVRSGAKRYEPLVHSSGAQWVDVDRSTGQIYTFCYDSSAWMWDLGLKGLPYQSIDAGRTLQWAALSPNGRYIASGSRNAWSVGNEVTLWDAQTRESLGTAIRSSEIFLHTVFSSDSAALAVATTQNVFILEVPSGRILSEIRIQEQSVGLNSISFSPDNRFLLVCELNRVMCYRVSDGELLHSIGNPDQAGLTNWASFGEDGTRILVAYDSRNVDFWDTESWSRIHRFDFGIPSNIEAMSDPVGRRMVIVSFQYIFFIDSQTFQVTHAVSHEGEPSVACFDASGTRFAVGYTNGKIRIWDCKDDLVPLSEFNHTSMISSLAFGPDGTWIASGSDDRTGRLWDVETGSPVSPKLQHEALTYVECFRDGSTLMTASIDGVIRLWPIPTFLKGPNDWLLGLADLVAGGEIGADDEFHVYNPLVAEEIRQRLLDSFDNSASPALFNRYLVEQRSAE